MNVVSGRWSEIILFLAVLLLVVHHFFFYYGHFGYDDMHYARLSSHLLGGQVDWSDHYSYRLTVLVATAGVYALWGIGDFASAVPALLCSVGVLVLFYKSFREQSLVLLVVIAVYFSYRWNLFYSDKLMPDIYVSFFGLLGWYGYLRSRSSASWRYCFLTAVSLFFAFNAKGTIILLLPIFFGYLFIDMCSGRFLFWRRLAPLLTPLLGVYFLMTWLLTGSALSRFRAIDANHYDNACSYDQQSTAEVFSRITDQFWSLMLSEQLYIPLLLTIVVCLYARWRSVPIRWIFPLTIIVGLLSADLMTISPTSYNPVCLDPRHLLLFTPIFAMCIGYMLRDIMPLVIADNRMFRVGLVLFSFVIMTPTVQQMLSNRKMNYPQLRAELYLAMDEPNLKNEGISGSTVMCNLLAYYTEYRGHKCDVDAGKSDMYIQCWYTDWHSGVQSPPSGYIRIDEDWAKSYRLLSFYRKE